MIERLKNCPNCAGIIDDAGRCNYCGSKVYDFIALNFSSKEQKSNAQTFIRIRLDDGEYVLPILSFDNASITMTPQYDEFDFGYGGRTLSKIVSIERRVDLSCFCGELMKVGGVKE
jgi:hypothetical protein